MLNQKRPSSSVSAKEKWLLMRHEKKAKPINVKRISFLKLE
jgi:hypothetical protein